MRYICLILISILFVCCVKNNAAQVADPTTETLARTDTYIMDSVLNAPPYSNRYEVLETIYVTKEENGIDGCFVNYKLNEHANVSVDKDYPRIGIAFFEKTDNQYTFLFENPDAMFCYLCNNATHQQITVKEKNVLIDISWGPRENKQFDHFQFTFEPQIKKWALTLAQKWKIDTTLPKVYLDSYTSDTIAYQVYDLYELQYKPGEFSKLRTDYKKYLDDGEYHEINNQHNFIFRNREIRSIIQNINDNNIDAAIECCSLLVRYGRVHDAAPVLNEIFIKYPEKPEPLKLLGDGYYNWNQQPEKTKEVYTTYINLLKENNQESLIPEYITKYIETGEVQELPEYD